MPVNPTNQIGIINAALVRCGQSPIASLQDPSAQAVAATTLYESVRRNLLSSYPWQFALAEVTEPAALAVTENDFSDTFQYAFKVPQDALRVLGLAYRYPYMISGGEIWTGVEDPQILFIENVDGTQRFPPWFVTAFEYALAEAFVLAVTEDVQRWEKFQGLSRQEAAKARNIDSQTRTPLRLKYEDLFLQDRNPRF